MIVIVIVTICGLVAAFRYRHLQTLRKEYKRALNDWNSDYCFYGDHLYHYSVIYNDKLPKISFENFHRFYLLNPSKWDLHPNYLTYSKNRCQHEHLFFETPQDFHLYKKFKAQIEQEKKDEETRKRDLENNKKLMAILEDVQVDINAIKEKSKREQAEAFTTILDSAARLYGNDSIDGETKDTVLRLIQNRGNACSSGDTSCEEALMTSPPQELYYWDARPTYDMLGNRVSI